MKKILISFFAVILFSSFMISKAAAQENMTPVAAYILSLEDNSNIKDGTGLLILYEGGGCDIIAADERVVWDARQTRYSTDGKTFKITATDTNGVVLEQTFVLTPWQKPAAGRYESATEGYRAVWESFLDDGKPVYASLFTALGVINKDGSSKTAGIWEKMNIE